MTSSQKSSTDTSGAKTPDKKAPVGYADCILCHHYWLNRGDCTGANEKCEDFKNKK